ncbi:MAG: vWA domain-containing protein [Byssovorax sp.]
MLTTRWMVGVASVLVTSGVALGACSGVEIPSDPTSGSSSGSGGDDSGGAGAGGSLDLDAGKDGPVVISPDAACATSTVQANLTPVDLFLLFDRSASMAYKSKWDAATAALTSFFQNSSSAGLRVALRFFPEDGCDNMACSAEACGQPLVPLGMLLSSSGAADAQEQALVAASSSKMPAPNEIMGGGGTPLSAALGGAESWAMAQHAKHPEDRVAVVLVSDGEANGCDKTAATINGIVAAGHGAGVDTFAIGLAGYFEAGMNDIAQSGGTGQAFFIGKTDVEQDLLEALQSIQQKEVSCALPMPQGAPDKPVDPLLINVDYTPGGGAAGILGQVPSAAGCGAGGGWYYDNPAAPTQITLCPATCSTVQADALARIDIILGCQTEPAK